MDEKRVLIVDDEAYIRLLISQTLEDLEAEGLEILQTDNGEDALRLVREVHPQVVLLDVMIPKINGFEVCRTIKQELKMEDVFVVILTAKGQAYDQHTAKSYGANYSMTKPFDPDGLLALVTEVLNKDGMDHA